jgi:hypothetical protein
MTSRSTALKQHGEQLSGKRSGILSLWQEVAENFYIERADFTTVRNTGAELGSTTMTSYPIIARRQLGDAFGAMLRPTSKEWAHVRSSRPDKEDTAAKQWLQWVSGYMRNVMYDKRAMFTRATKEADHDYAAFGQAVISVELNPSRDGVLYRCWHLRDVAWAEGPTGAIDTIVRKWKPTVSELCRIFPKTVHQKVKEKQAKNPYDEVDVLHTVMPAEVFAELDGTGGKKFRTPYVSVYTDTTNDHEMECVGSWTPHYVIPRWATVSGSQYAHSPAVVAGLPDARLIQQVTLTLLEAGEKAVNPPMVAVQEAIRGDISIYAGGTTWVDAEYDERLGEVLKPMTQDSRGLAFGMEWAGDLRTQLADAFYLSKLNMPPVGGPEMTAYEVGQRVQEFIRNALPLFEPMERDYNGQICEQTLELMIHASPEIRNSAPDSLREAELSFQFESPLHDAIEKTKVGQFLEASQILATAMQLDPSVALIVDNRKATRDTLGAAIPSAWMRTEAEVDKMAKEQARQAQTQQLLDAMQKGADVAKTISEAVPTAGLGGAGVAV